MAHFIFSTGIENSCPKIGHGRTRIDEMALCDHYRRWREDFDLVEDLGVKTLRYGLPLCLTWPDPGRYDWEFADLAFGNLEARGIIPIADLCHFGAPDWIGDFQNPDFPELFAEYPHAFAERYRFVQLYTPVNEMYICATFSAAYGWWNEQLSTDWDFVTALKHIVKANALAMHSILGVRPDAIFVQSESTEYFHSENPAALEPAEKLNERRFLSLDLNYGRRVNSEMFCFLMDNGMSCEEYNFFMQRPLKSHCIMGNDYYEANEHNVDARGKTTASGELFGYNEITRQYYDRYGLPVMHTEPTRRKARAAMKPCAGCARNGRMCCGCATAACRSSASLGLADRSDRLGHCAARISRPRLPAWTLRPRSKAPHGGQGL